MKGDVPRHQTKSSQTPEATVMVMKLPRDVRENGEHQPLMIYFPNVM